MIRYSLKCAAAHDFDSWFRSSAAFDDLHRAGHIACPVCGSASVEKSLMAPTVRPARKSAANAAPSPDPSGGAGALSAPVTAMEQAMAVMRREIEENSEYVGLNFAREARRIHDGDAPERAIYGEAKMEEARKLLEDGVPVAPLPFMPARKTN